MRDRAGGKPPRPGAARFVAGAARAEHIPKPHGPEIAFAGKSNVGKSSLLNRLVGHHGLARVSKTPGRTQQINFFAIGDELTFVDLPGYGFARVPRAVQDEWRVLIEHYLSGRRTLRAVVVIIDVRRGVEDADAALLDFLDAQGVVAILVATKIDKLKRSERARLLAAAAGGRPGLEPIAFSADTGEGAAELWQALRAAARHERHGDFG